MKCDRARYLISRSLDGDISVREMIDVERHLAECSHCSVVAHDLARIVGELSSVSEETAPEGLAFAVQSRIAHQPVGAPAYRMPVRRGLQRTLCGAVALIVLLIVGGGYVRVRTHWAPVSGEEVARTVDGATAQVLALAAADPLEDITIVNALHCAEPQKAKPLNE